MKRTTFINAVLWVILGIVSIIVVAFKCGHPFVLVPILAFMLPMFLISAPSLTCHDDEVLEKGGAAVMAMLLFFSGLFAFWNYMTGNIPLGIKIICGIWSILSPAELVCKCLDVSEGIEEGAEEEDEDEDENEDEDEDEDENEDENENEDGDDDENDTGDEPQKTGESILDQLVEIGNKCPNTHGCIVKALNQIYELQDLRLTLEKLETVIYKKTTIEALHGVYKKLVLYVGQNMRDILAVCIAGRAIQNKGLTKDELKTIDKELSSNENKINHFKENLKRAASASIQKNDAFSDLDIDSELAAIDSFTKLKGSETDVFSPTTKPGA